MFGPGRPPGALFGDFRSKAMNDSQMAESHRLRQLIKSIPQGIQQGDSHLRENFISQRVRKDSGPVRKSSHQRHRKFRVIQKTAESASRTTFTLPLLGVVNASRHLIARSGRFGITQILSCHCFESNRPFTPSTRQSHRALTHGRLRQSDCFPCCSARDIVLTSINSTRQS